MNKFLTTELLELNLSDFLEKARLDIETNKYNHKLVETGSITRTDTIDFLKRISDNFDLEKSLAIWADIETWNFQFNNEEYATAAEWEFIFTDDGKPCITEILKEVLAEELDLHIFRETNYNPDYINDKIKRCKSNPLNAELLEVAIKAYDDACLKVSTSKSDKSNNSQSNTKKRFEDLLLPHSAVLMDKLHELLDKHDSGKHVATVRAALVLKGYLQKKSRITPKLITEFNLQCSPQSINGYVTNPTEVQLIVNLLP